MEGMQDFLYQNGCFNMDFLTSEKISTLKRARWPQHSESVSCSDYSPAQVVKLSLHGSATWSKASAYPVSSETQNDFDKHDSSVPHLCYPF
jgi:hypothetical protein